MFDVKRGRGWRADRWDFARNVGLRVCGAALGLVFPVGCRTYPGSLATDSGPSTVGWSTQPQQLVHVGEDVRFSFVLSKDYRREVPIHPFGIADYCLARVGRQQLEAELAATGQFRFSHSFDEFQPGQTVIVSAAAYREQGIRDVMKIGDEWVQANSPSDAPDDLVSQAAVEITLYKSRIELPVERPLHDLDMGTGHLEIQKSDGTVSRIEAGQAGEGGFVWSGPNSAGTYTVIYEPTASQLNKTGQTPVRFIAQDVAGNPHVIDAALNTP